MLAIVDYGVGNLRSVEKACEFAGIDDVRITSSATVLENASHIILPGVGAAGDAVNCLRKSGLFETVINQSKKKPFLGICVGMQLLFEKSLENGVHECLGLIKGNVVPFDVLGLRVPHIGWNKLILRQCPLFDVPEYVYFVHSYHATDVPDECISALSTYGYEFVAAVQRENIFGVQFHPEKSGSAGIEMIKRFGGIKI